MAGRGKLKHRFCVATYGKAPGTVRLLGQPYKTLEEVREARKGDSLHPTHETAIYKLEWGVPLLFVEGADLKATREQRVQRIRYRGGPRDGRTEDYTEEEGKFLDSIKCPGESAKSGLDGYYHVRTAPHGYDAVWRSSEEKLNGC